MIGRLRARQEWQFLSILPKASPILAMRLVAGSDRPRRAACGICHRDGVAGRCCTEWRLAYRPLTLVGFVFVGLQTLAPLHQVVGANLGSRTAAWLYDQLAHACVEPPGMGHLENPKLTSDLTMARDFDLGISGPPLSISMDFIASGLVEFLAGITAALVLAAFAWWAPWF